MVKVEIGEIFVSDIDGRLRGSSSEPSSEGILKRIASKCNETFAISEELSSGGQFSVFASLPSVSSAVSAASSTTMTSLVSLLKFINGSDVFASDVKDWAFIEDSLDSLFARIDESLAMDSRPVKKQRVGDKTGEQDVSRSKPQSAWANLINNNRRGFVPVIKYKPNAIVPLDHLILQAQQDPSIVRDGHEFAHVYEPEIKACLAQASQEISKMDTLKEIVESLPISETELVYVNTVEKLDSMVEAIIAAGEVAIDLEHHDIHSYRGFTSLIQLSTRTTDYIVDPFPLFGQLGDRLNRFTTDPHIKKTFHGADMDMQWLQRDFGVYIVNMFDTGQAARALGLAGGFGLANLLETFCQVQTNKRFQTSDWRTRPLPKDMLQYARCDTHYLLYIRDRLENLLLGMGSGTTGLVTVYGRKMLCQVMEKSFQVSLKIWRDSQCDFTVEGADQLCLKSPALKVGRIRSNPNAMAVLRAVLEWRDQTARRLDESRNYVLSNSCCFRIANALPSTVPQILRIVTQEASTLHPSMRIGTEEADEILLRLNHVVQITPSSPIPSNMDVEMTPTSEPRKSLGSVVQVGGMFGKRMSTSKRPSDASRPSLSEKVESSALFSFFKTMEPTTAVSTKHSEVLEKLLKELNECPEGLLEDLRAIREGVSVEAIEASAAAMADAIAAVPFGTEFVPLVKTSTKKEPQMLDEEGLPLPIREQRKRAPTADAVSSGKKPKRVGGTSSAAVKALEFIEQELSLNSRK